MINNYLYIEGNTWNYQDLTMKNDDFDTYEQAVEAALKYCLTKVI